MNKIREKQLKKTRKNILRTTSKILKKKRLFGSYIINCIKSNRQDNFLTIQDTCDIINSPSSLIVIPFLWKYTMQGNYWSP